MGNYYDSWKKYGLPMPRRECVHPERRIAWDRGYNEGLKGCVTTQ
jgi:hypothetical protein